MARGLVCLALLLALAPATASAAEPAAMACSPTLMPLMERVAQTLAEREPPLQLTLRETPPDQAVAELLAGEADLTGLARQLTPLEEAQARGKGLGLTPRRVGTDCLLAVVHPQNPIFDLSLADLRGIFSGRIRKWCEVGGKEKPILVVVRPPESGAAQVWLNKAMDRALPRPDASVQETHQEVVEAVAGNKLAIGYISRGFLDPSVKALSLGGINPGAKNVAAGRYPVCRPLVLVAPTPPHGAAKAALEHLLSPQGQALMREMGFLPLK